MASSKVALIIQSQSCKDRVIKTRLHCWICLCCFRLSGRYLHNIDAPNLILREWHRFYFLKIDLKCAVVYLLALDECTLLGSLVYSDRRDWTQDNVPRIFRPVITVPRRPGPSSTKYWKSDGHTGRSTPNRQVAHFITAWMLASCFCKRW